MQGTHDGRQAIGGSGAAGIRVRGTLAIPVALGVAVATAVAVAGPAITAAQSCSRVITAGIVRAEGCFTQSGTVYTATQSVDMNGVQVRATPESRLTINTQTRQVSARNAAGTLVPIQLAIQGLPSTENPRPFKFDRLDFVAPQPGVEPDKREVVIGYAPLIAPTLAGLNPLGTVDVPIKISQPDFDNEATGSIAFQYRLPGALTLKGIQGGVSVPADLFPGRGAVFDGIEIEASGLTIGGVMGVDNLEFRYRASQRLWEGALDILFPIRPKAGGVKVGTAGAEGRIRDGRIERFGVTFGVPIEVFPQVFFNSGSLALEPSPFDLSGRVGFSAGEDLPKGLPIIGGRSPIAGSIGLGIQEPGGVGSVKQGVFSLRGQIDLFEIVPMVKAEFNTYFYGPAIVPPRGQLNSISFGANFGLGLPRFTNTASGNVFFVGGAIRGWWEGAGVNPATGGTARALYNFEGSVRQSILGWDVTGAQAVISNRGLAACVKPIFWSPYIGGGYSYRSGFRVLGGFTGCGIGDYRETARGLREGRDRWAMRGVQDPEDAQVLELGEDEQTLRIKGTEEVPSFELESRAGERIDYRWNGESPVFGPNRDWVVLGDPSSDTAYVLMRDPEGSWAIADTSEEGEIAVTEQARTVDPPTVTADVVGKGLRKRVRWSAEGMRPNDEIRLYETLGDGGRNRILETEESEGSSRFVSALGADEEHELRGFVTRQGAPFEDRLLDSFEVVPPKPPARPRRVRAHRRGTRVVARWKRVPEAKNYVVVLEDEDGGISLPKLVSPEKTKFVFRRASVEPRMRVQVFATGRLGFPSKPGVRHFRAIPRDQSPARSVREMLRSVRVSPSGNLGFLAPCPGDGQCALTVRASRRGEEIAGASSTAIPQSNRRLHLRLPQPLRAELRQGEVRRFTLEGTFDQAERNSAHRIRVQVFR